MPRSVNLLLCCCLLWLLAGCAEATLNTSSIILTRRTPVSTVPAEKQANHNAFVVEEHAIASDAGGLPQSVTDRQRIRPGVLARRARDRNPPPSQHVAPSNRLFKKYGYRLMPDLPLSSPTYLLYQNNALVLDEIAGFRPPTENAAGDDFAMWLYLEKQGEKILTRDGLREWQHDLTSTAPILGRARTGSALHPSSFSNRNLTAF